jgi:hypothetical protein
MKDAERLKVRTQRLHAGFERVAFELRLSSPESSRAWIADLTPGFERTALRSRLSMLESSRLGFDDFTPDFERTASGLG